MTRDQKYEAFRALHERAGAFVIPNPWDAGTARILTALGFEALATTSAGCAFSAGYRDSSTGLTRDEILENAKAMVEATDLPVSADLENGFGRSPEMCAETIRLAATIGLAGGSIEDASGDPRRSDLRLRARGGAGRGSGEGGSRFSVRADRPSGKLPAWPL